MEFAWQSTRVGMTWFEQEYDQAKKAVHFLAVGRDGRLIGERVYDLKTAKHLALCSSDNGWVLAFASLDGKVFVVALDGLGRPTGAPVEISGKAKSNLFYHSGIHILSAANTPIGTAVVFATEEEGVLLILLDKELKVRKTVAINAPHERSQGFLPRISCNGNGICVAWIQPGYCAQLLVQTFDCEGNPRGDATVLSETVWGMVGPTSYRNGFVVAWLDFSQSPYQVRFCEIGPQGKLGKQTIAHNARGEVDLIAVGVQGDTARIVLEDRLGYPYKILLKEMQVPSN
jgi:hypothetical protein